MKKLILNILAFLYIFYLVGLVGLFTKKLRGSDRAVPMFIILACINVMVWTLTIKLLLCINLNLAL